MKKVFKGTTVEDCITAAASEIGIEKEKLLYEILEVKKGFFSKKASILVETDLSFYNENYMKQDTSEELAESKANFSDLDGTCKIVNGEIIIKNPKDGGRPAVLIVKNGVNLKINNQCVTEKAEVYENSIIEILFKENTPSRNLNVSISEDSMEAYVSIDYKPQYTYKLKDKSEANQIDLEEEINDKVMPTLYSYNEVKKVLSESNVVYGIIEENIKNVCDAGGTNVLAAKGKKAVDGVDDKIVIKFALDSTSKKFVEDDTGNIDFKSIGSVEAVNKGDIIAVNEKGKSGQDGIDIKGKTKKCRAGKIKKLKSGQGCILKDENTVEAAIDGKPCCKGNVFYVYELHEVRNDVDIKTGNIKFIGDIIVHGSVREGMKIESGNSLTVQRDVERAEINSKGNITVNGTVIASKVVGGGEDVLKLESINDLKNLLITLENIINVVEEVKKFNILGQDKKDGEIIKILIDTKFKSLQSTCLKVIAHMNEQSEENSDENLITFIKTKLLGLGPINIKNYGELDSIIKTLREKIEFFKASISIPVNVSISYCQNSELQSSGDVIITGGGAYVSSITANNNVYFTQEKSISRGGQVKAKNEIRCKIVGSLAGVSTRLEVESQGHIWVDIAYQNTQFVVGGREFLLDVPSRNIHAYLDDKGEIIVDRLKL